MATLTKGQHRLIGKGGEWGSTRCITALMGKLYTCDNNGNLYVVDPSSETHTQLGQGGWASRIITNTYNRLFTVEDSGTIFSINAEDGTFAKVGEDGQWGTTRAMCGVRGNLYTNDENGKLYGIDPWTGKYREVGADTWSSTCLYDGGDYLVTLVQNGTWYRVQTKDGSWEPFGEKEGWTGVKATACKSGSIFAVGETGTLYKAGTWGTEYEKIAESYNSRLAVMGDYYLYTIEEDGSMYEIGVY